MKKKKKCVRIPHFLGINGLGTFPYKEKKLRKLRKVINDMCCENEFLKKLYERGIIMKEKKNMYRFPYFIRNKWFKENLIRSKERMEINEKDVLISLFYEESKI